MKILTFDAPTAAQKAAEINAQIDQLRPYVEEERVVVQVLTKSGLPIAGELMAITDEYLSIGVDAPRNVLRSDIQGFNTSYVPGQRLIV